MGIARIELYTGFEQIVESAERDRLRELVKRRSAREPVAYLLGEKEFYSLRFEVSPAVLIPRPDTEHLVDAALECLGEGRASALDLGTGSGCIAVALAHARPALEVDAVDVSAEALAVAAANARLHGVEGRVTFLDGDLFGALEPSGGHPAGEHSGERRRYDLIVSNPPYVRREEIESLCPEIQRHEPQQALIDTRSPNSDGLGFYRDIAGACSTHLVNGGAVLVEVGEGQAGAVRELFERAGLDHTTTRRDYGGIDRVVIARRRSDDTSPSSFEATESC